MKRTAMTLVSRWSAALLLALPVAFGAVSAPAQEQSVAPGINRHYENADFSRWQRSFESPGREVFDRRLDIIAASGVRAGMTVADIGAGTGLFTWLFAGEVGPGGKVYAEDIAPEFVQALRELAREKGLGNVDVILGTARDTRLPAASVDLAFLSDAYHHFEYPESMLASIRRALRPGGTLVVIDFEKVPGESSAWILGHVRAPKDTVVREIQAEGFRLLEDRKFLRENYFLKFRPP